MDHNSNLGSILTWLWEFEFFKGKGRMVLNWEFFREGWVIIVVGEERYDRGRFGKQL